MSVNERQQQILQTLLADQQASVAELSDLLQVSTVTIRHDLNVLAQQGRVIRTRGGAAMADGRSRQELTFATRQRMRAESKRRIGERAAMLVQPFEAILLDASTTAVAVGQAIKRNRDLQEITIVTAGIWTALELLDTPNINVVLAGGALRTTTGSTTGLLTHQLLEQFNFNRVFLGAWGLTLNEGLTDTHLAEVELKQTIIKRAQEVIGVLDGSKFGRLGFASFAAVEQVNCIVTDSTAPADAVEALRERGVLVLVAE